MKQKQPYLRGEERPIQTIGGEFKLLLSVSYIMKKKSTRICAICTTFHNCILNIFVKCILNVYWDRPYARLWNKSHKF